MKVNISGINDIKYPIRNNHKSLADFIHFDANAMIRRGTARITKRTGAVSKCLCCRHCSRKSSL